MVSIADPVFVSGIDEKLAAVDVYSQTSTASDSGLINSITNPTDLDEFMGMDGVDASELADPEGLDLTSEAIKTAVFDDLPELKGDFSQLDVLTQAELLKVNGFEDIKIADSAFPEMLPQRPAFMNTKNALALVKIAATISSKGGLKAVSIAASAQFLSNLVAVSVKNGVPNMYARIDAAGYDTSVMARVTNNSLGIAARTGNLNLMMNLANGSMAGSIKGMFPGFPAAFAAGFKLDKNMKPQFYGQIASSISTSFGKIDVNWAKGANGSTFNANLFLGGSRDFRTVAKASLRYASSPWSRSSTTTASVATSLPGVGSFNLGIRGNQITVGGVVKMQYQWPSGRKDVYTERQGGGYDVVSTKPTPVFDPDGSPPTGDASDYYDVDNSTIDDPMVKGGLVCSQYDDESDDTPMGTQSSIDSSFPLLDLSDDW